MITLLYYGEKLFLMTYLFLVYDFFLQSAMETTHKFYGQFSTLKLIQWGIYIPGFLTHNKSEFNMLHE